MANRAVSEDGVLLSLFPSLQKGEQAVQDISWTAQPESLQSAEIIFISDATSSFLGGTPHIEPSAIYAGSTIKWPRAGKAVNSQAREYPNHMYVDKVTVVRRASGIVAIVAVFSLAVTILTGFKMIHPLFAAVLVIWAATFFGMSKLMSKQGRDDNGGVRKST